MAIRIQLRNPLTGLEQKFCFDQSPIRIGRNILNDIVMDDAFVSQWHGLIRFNGTEATYLDLGSTNGSMFAGRRLHRNEVLPLESNAPLVIAPFQLVFTTIPGTHERRSEPCATPLRRIVSASADSQAMRSSTDSDRLHLCMRLLEGFSNAFVALMKSVQEFGAEVGVRPLCGSTPLHRARSGQEVLDYLFASGSAPEARLHNLQAIFADMGIHQIALTEGITQGIRGLLESLDPTLQEGQGGPGFFSRSRSRSLWTSYCERFATLIAEDGALHTEIFGEAFARAYASVAPGLQEQLGND